jgi:hypothetical protein
VTSPPTQDELEKLLTQIAHRVVKMLVKKNYIEKSHSGGLVLPQTTSAFGHIQGASITYCIAFGKHKGKKALSLQAI